MKNSFDIFFSMQIIYLEAIFSLKSFLQINNNTILKFSIATQRELWKFDNYNLFFSFIGPQIKKFLFLIILWNV